MGGEQETLPALLRRNRVVHGAKPAVVADGRSVTHAELDTASRDLAGRLVAAGVGKSSRLGLLLPNGVAWALLAAAVTRIGAVLVPLSTLLRPPELLAQLRTAHVTDLVVAPGFRGRSYLDDLESIAPGVLGRLAGAYRHPGLPALRHVWADDGLPAATVDEVVVGSLESRVRPSDDLAVLFTSGSRGTPKGIIHTHGNAIRATASGLECRCVEADDRLYIPMPFFWTGGFASGLMTVLVAGATLLTESVSEPDSTLELLRRERATLFRGWPDQAARLAAHPSFAAAGLSTLKPGSLPAVLPPALRPAPGATANLFGMTETFGPYSGFRLDTEMPAGKHGSCGRPFAGIEVVVVDPETGCPRPPGETGEIRLRGPNLMRGVCGRLREDTFDREGFYPTRDLGALDSDGYLWYHGRLDDMFKVRGATVYPTEVEDALRSIEGVRQAFATAVAGHGGGPAVGAVVISDLTVDRLTSAARARLSSFKVPTRWYVTGTLDEVPLMATGKVDQVGLRQLIEDKGQGDDR